MLTWTLLPPLLTHPIFTTTYNSLFYSQESVAPPALLPLAPILFLPLHIAVPSFCSPSHLRTSPFLSILLTVLFLILWYTILHASLSLLLCFILSQVPGNLGEIDLRGKQLALMLIREDEKWWQKRLKVEEYYRAQTIRLAFFSSKDLLDKLQHYFIFPKRLSIGYS